MRRITEAREGSRILANAAKDLLAIARELRSDEKNAREDDEGDCSDKTEKHASDVKNTSEDDKDKCSDETNPNFAMDEDIWERMMRRSVKMCKISIEFQAAIGAPGGEFPSIGPVKQLVRDAQLAMGVEFRLLKADLDRYSDDAA